MLCTPAQREKFAEINKQLQISILRFDWNTFILVL
jgi:hypothetical protein